MKTQGNSDQHLRIVTPIGMKVLWWNAADRLGELQDLAASPIPGESNVRFRVTLSINSFRGFESVQAVVDRMIEAVPRTLEEESCERPGTRLRPLPHRTPVGEGPRRHRGCPRRLRRDGAPGDPPDGRRHRRGLRHRTSSSSCSRSPTGGRPRAPRSPDRRSREVGARPSGSRSSLRSWCAGSRPSRGRVGLLDVG